MVILRCDILKKLYPGKISSICRQSSPTLRPLFLLSLQSFIHPCSFISFLYLSISPLIYTSISPLSPVHFSHFLFLLETSWEIQLEESMRGIVRVHTKLSIIILHSLSFSNCYKEAVNFAIATEKIWVLFGEMSSFFFCAIRVVLKELFMAINVSEKSIWNG